MSGRRSSSPPAVEPSYDARVRDLLRAVGPILRDAGRDDLAHEAVELWHTAVDLAREHPTL